MAGFDLASMLDDLNATGDDVSDAVTGATTAIQSNTQALTQSYQSSVARQQAVAASTKVVTDTQQLGKLQAQTALQNFAANIAGDTDDATGTQAKLAATFLQANSDAADALQTIKEKRSVSFFDDPLSWVSNKLTINHDIDQYNSNASIANQAEQQIDSTNQAISLRAAAQAQIATTVTAASAEAQSNIAVSSAQEAADVLGRQGIAQNTAGVKEVADMNYRQFQIATAGFDADARYQQLKQGQAQLAVSQANLSLEQQRFALMQKKEINADSANQYIADNINAGLKVMYPTNPAAWNVPAGKLQGIMSGKLPMDPILAQAMKIGENSKDTTLPDSGTRLLGLTPSDALTTLQFNPTIAPDMQGGVGILRQALDIVSKQTAGIPITTPAEKQAFDAKVNAQANALLQAAANHTQDPSSVYFLPGADQLAQQIPAIQQTPLYQKVLAPLIQAKVDLSNPDQVAGYAQKAIAAGTISLNDAAAGIAGMYQQGQIQNQASKQLIGLGLTPKISYMGNAAAAGTMGLSGKLDYTKQDQVMKNLMMRSSVDQFTEVIPAI